MRLPESQKTDILEKLHTFKTHESHSHLPSKEQQLESCKYTSSFQLLFELLWNVFPCFPLQRRRVQLPVSIEEAVALSGTQDSRRWKPPDFIGLIISLPQIIGILKELHKLCAKLNCIYHSFFDTVTKSKGDWKKEINLRKSNWYEVWLRFLPLKRKVQRKNNLTKWTKHGLFYFRKVSFLSLVKFQFWSFSPEMC